MRADLSRCDCQRANFHGATLIKASFAEADLSKATLTDTAAHAANFSGANLSEAYCWQPAKMGQCETREIRGRIEV